MAGGDGSTTVIDPFSSTNVQVTGVNAVGDVVGYYTDPSNSQTYGFLATPSAAPEPPQVGVMLLMGLSLGGLLLRARRKTPSPSL